MTIINGENTEIVKCDRCDGAGVVELSPAAQVAGGIHDATTALCPDCGGLGQVVQLKS